MDLNGGTTTTDRCFLSQGPLLTSGSSYTSTFWVKSNTAQSYVVQQRLGLSTQNITVDQTWRAYAYTQLISTDSTHWLALRGAQGTSDSADILIWHPQLVIGATSGQYQRVNTATDYDTDERYFKKYLRFDGVDDYLNLPYMGLYAGGSASVVAGINGHQFGKAYNGRIICESLVSANAPTYAPLIQLYTANTTNAFITNNAATILADIRLLLTQNDISAISMIDSGSSIKSYKNSAQKSSSAYTRSGTVTLDSTTIGKGMTNGSTEIWKGDLYGLIITKSALTDAQRIKCERFLARKAGVML